MIIKTTTKSNFCKFYKIKYKMWKIQKVTKNRVNGFIGKGSEKVE